MISKPSWRAESHNLPQAAKQQRGLLLFHLVMPSLCFSMLPMQPQSQPPAQKSSSELLNAALQKLRSSMQATHLGSGCTKQIWTSILASEDHGFRKHLQLHRTSPGAASEPSIKGLCWIALLYLCFACSST